MEASLKKLLQDAGIKIPYEIMYANYAKSVGTPVDDLTPIQKQMAFMQYGMRKLEEYQTKLQAEDTRFPKPVSMKDGMSGSQFPTFFNHSPVMDWFKRCVQQIPEQHDFIDKDSLIDRKGWGDAMVDWKSKWLSQFYELVDPELEPEIEVVEVDE